MIKINLHGILGSEFGREFRIYAKNAFFALKSIDCIKKGFLNKLRNLQKDGLTYSIIINDEWIYDKNNFFCLGEIKQIDLVPNICGAIDLVGALLTGLMVGLAVFTAGASIAAALAVGALTAGLNILMQVLNKPKDSKANTQFVGGQTMSSAAQAKNYAFSNTDNVSAQNIPVPIGYGRMRVGTKIIQTSIKSYPTNQSVFSEFSQSNNILDKISVGFIS